jgi:hypothetical protein
MVDSTRMSVSNVVRGQRLWRLEPLFSSRRASLASLVSSFVSGACGEADEGKVAIEAAYVQALVGVASPHKHQLELELYGGDLPRQRRSNV